VSLEIRVLGELQVARDGEALALPASRKTRALLGYLVVSAGRHHSRQALCDLFWDGPEDPRAALRWSLTKLRPLVDDADRRRLSADREHVLFDSGGAQIDVVTAGACASSSAAATTAALRTAADLFRGELLEGLDLPGCYRYHEWCIAEREAARRARVSILATLADRFSSTPEDALSYARARVSIDPLTEAGHVVVMQLLARLGRARDALKQYESCRRVLESQLSRRPSADLEAARASLGQPASTTSTRPEPVVVPAPLRGPLVGRETERASIAQLVAEAAAGACARVLLVTGEPGIGKTRLLQEAADQIAARGGRSLAGRAFEAEMVRPYGPWIDALRSAPLGAVDDSLRAELSPLLPELGAARGEADQTRLFDAVAKSLGARSAAAPLLVALDDIQWFDEASVALLHYVARAVSGSRVLVACAARSAELDANERVRGLVRGLTRDARLAHLDLAPLDADATRELVRGVDRHADTARIFVDGGGNPLFSLELASALAHGGGATTQTLDSLIAERLSRLDEGAADLLPWAAALGHAFTIDTLATLTSLPARDLLAAVGDLERYGVLRVSSSELGSVGYDFVHDLVRRAAYRAMSEPRRGWVHLQIARALAATSDPDGALAGDVAHHAAVGGDNELAARFYVAAGERSWRLFASADASRLAASGLQHVARLPAERAIPLRVALLGVQAHSGQWIRRAHALEDELSRLAADARARGMHAEATRCFYLMSLVHHERGEFARASDRSLEAARAGRAADAETRQQQLANTGRCLALIGRDLAQAEELLREAQALGPCVSGPTAMETTAGLGFVHAFKGQDDEAVPLLERAVELAAAQSDYWLQSQTLARLASLELDRGRPREALARCAALELLVAKLIEGSEGPFVAALHALALLELGEGDAAAVEATIATLRALDSKAHLAYVLDVFARHERRAGSAERARRHAEEALGAAEVVGQKSEAAVARSVLAELAIDRGQRDEALALLRACGAELATPLALSARARTAVLDAAERMGVTIPTLVPSAATTPAREEER
jgi:DNA-binding SARP family transcriptional activator/tetratricopeptide (TPR) repeat protein